MYRHWGSVQAVRPIGGVEVQLYSFLTTALEGGEGSASRPCPSLPPGKTRYPLYWRLGGPQGRSGRVRKISPPPGFDPRTVQPVASRYTDWATRPTYIYIKNKKTTYTQTVYLFKNTILPMPHIYISFTNTNKNYTENLQEDLETLGEWAVENGMKINPSKGKAIRFTRARVKNPLGYSLCEQKIPEASSCKYLGIIIWSNLNCVDQVNYTAQKAWKALHFLMHVLKQRK